MPRYVEKGAQKPSQKEAASEPVQSAPAPATNEKASDPEVPREAPKPKKKYVEKGPDYKQPAPKEATTEQAEEKKREKAPNPQKNTPKKADRPKYKQTDEPNTQEKGEVKVRKDKYQPSYNNRRSKYNWNRRNITEETVVPDMPKVILKKPDEAALDKKIKELNDKIKALEASLRDKNETKRREIQAARQEKTTFSKLSSANLAKLRQLQGEMRKQRSLFGDLVKSQKGMLTKLKELRSNQVNYRNSTKLDFKSESDLKVKKDNLEHMLITKQLTAKERRKVQDDINECARHLVNARQDYELDLEQRKLHDLIEIEQAQLNKLNAELTVIRTEINRLDGQIKAIQSLNESEEKNIQRVRSREEIEDEYQRDRQAILDEIYRNEDEITSLEDAYRYELSDFREQEELIEWIKFAQEEKKIIKEEKEKYEKLEKERKAEQERRKKERERELAEKQKKKEEWEQKKKEREERDKRYQEQLDKKLNSLPFDEEKKLCAFLKEYCDKLKPKTQVLGKVQEKTELVLTGDWQKEAKKGAKLIRNKKQGDEPNELDITKSMKKPEKKVERKPVEIPVFDHTIHIIRLFESIHVPPPVKQENLDETIQAIDKRIEYYENPSEEDIKKHREKVAAEHNRGSHGNHYVEDAKPERKHEKVERDHRPPRLAESDFPAL